MDRGAPSWTIMELSRSIRELSWTERFLNSNMKRERKPAEE